MELMVGRLVLRVSLEDQPSVNVPTLKEAMGVDYTTGAKAKIDFGFVEDASTVDVGYPDVRVPTLILHGTRDDVVPIERSRTCAAGKPHVRLVELDDGHELVASLPTLLAQTEAFLDELGNQPAVIEVRVGKQQCVDVARGNRIRIPVAAFKFALLK